MSEKVNICLIFGYLCLTLSKLCVFESFDKAVSFQFIHFSIN